MSPKELVRLFRVKFPEYQGVAEEVLLDQILQRYPEYSRLLVDTRGSDAIAGLKDLSGGLIGNFFGRISTASRADLMTERSRLATEILRLEEKHAAVREAEVRTAAARIKAEYDILITQALAENRIAVARKATEAGVPVEDYAALIRELIQLQFIAAEKQARRDFVREAGGAGPVRVSVKVDTNGPVT
jgi:hypothetical protein